MRAEVVDERDPATHLPARLAAVGGATFDGVCGIAGHVRAQGGADEATLDAMCRRMEHRGPDSQGIHTDGEAGIAIRRLRIIDLETGDQPVFSEDGRVAVVLNGEIYNYRELRKRLIAQGHVFRTQGDSEVIAHLYEEEGDEFVSSLIGMFAVAVWDGARRRLVLARDRVGKKPLFYSWRAGSLAFASELGALLADPSIPRDVDWRAIDAYLALRYVPSPLSAFAAVRKLPPASRLVLEHGGEPRIERYWALDYRPKHVFGSEEEMHEELRERLRTAVRRRLVADVPVGAFLSGGIDSSAVVAAMAEATTEPVRTFSIGFDSQTLDELPQARAVARRFGTQHEEFVVEPHAVDLLPTLIRHFGEPFADPTAIPTAYLAELTRRSVTVALNGDGGDETFGGYTRYVANLAAGRADRVPVALRRGAGAALRAIPSNGRIDSWPNRLHRVGTTLALPPGDRYFAYMSRLNGFDRDALYTPEMATRVNGSVAGEFILGPWRSSPSDGLLDRMLDVDVQGYLPDDLLTKVDIASMAYSLEARSPLLDHELMEWAAALPAKAKIRGTQKKVALRAALRGWVPDDILDAPKRGFQPPIADWFRGELRPFAEELLLDETARERGLFRPDVVRGLLGRHTENRQDNSQALWTLAVLELWLRSVA